MAQGDDKFDGADEKFEEAHSEDNAFDAAHAEESATRAHLQRARNMAGYVTGTANNPEEEEEEENLEGNCTTRRSSDLGLSIGAKGTQSA